MHSVKTDRFDSVVATVKNGASMNDNVKLFALPDDRVDLDDLSSEEFQQRFKGFNYLLVQRGRRTVFAACRTTRDELMEVVERAFSDKTIFNGHVEMEFVVAHGPDYLDRAFAGLRKLAPGGDE